jgi:hypothetical protein
MAAQMLCALPGHNREVRGGAGSITVSAGRLRPVGGTGRGAYRSAPVQAAPIPIESDTTVRFARAYLGRQPSSVALATVVSSCCLAVKGS